MGDTVWETSSDEMLRLPENQNQHGLIISSLQSFKIHSVLKLFKLNDFIENL